MKNRIYELSFIEANKFLKVNYRDLKDLIRIEKNFYSLQKKLKNHNWTELVGTRFSWLFIKDLVELRCNEEVLSIISEIKSLEKPEEFQSYSKDVQIAEKGLEGLYYKHYVESMFKAINKLNIQKYIILNSKYNKTINKLIYKRIEENQSEYSPVYAILSVFKEQFFDNFLLRSGVIDESTLKLQKELELEGKTIKKLTGEFFIFHKYKNQNYYLALWKHHNECKQDKSSYKTEELKKARQIKMYCEKEFSEFSNEILPSV